MIIEGFAVETIDDLIFSVKGLLHPPGRVIAYLRYLPDPEGERTRNGVRYRRVYHFNEQEAILGARYPVYLADDPVSGLRLQSVPRSMIRTVHDPRSYLTSLYDRGPDDPLEEDALVLAALLRETAVVSGAGLGVSGSLMVGLQQPSSDLDLIIYGEETGRKVYQALQDAVRHPSGPLRRPARQELMLLHAEHRPDTPLPFKEFARLQDRKVNELRFRGRETFVRFVKLIDEIDECYGDRRFEQLGTCVVRARVVDDRDAIFTPCRYGIEGVTFLDGAPAPDPQKIVSYRGRFSDQVRGGEWAVARGQLERVVGRDGTLSHRLVVGGQAGDYLRPCEDDQAQGFPGL